MNDKIILGHGSGGRLTRDLIKEIFIKELGEIAPDTLDDGAILPARKEKLVFTTDSYVVNPIEFPGGNIGDLAVSGTVNDLAVMGATPLYLSLGVILEEGFEISILKKVVKSIAKSAKMAKIQIVCGDTKVVEKGKGDGIFINTSGIGILDRPMDENSVKPGDKIIISGTIGDHGMTILTMRKGFPLKSSLQSDAFPLNTLIKSVTDSIQVKWMRDPTRGGVATALNEFAEGKQWGIILSESNLPINPAVYGLSEILGLDPLYSANEGKVLMVVDQKDAMETLEILNQDSHGKNASVVGEISNEYAGKLVLKTEFDTLRTLNILNSDPLPRIC